MDLLMAVFKSGLSHLSSKEVLKGVSRVNHSIPELTDDSVASSSSSNPLSSCAVYSCLPCSEDFLGVHWSHGRAHLVSNVNLFMSYKHVSFELKPMSSNPWVLSHLCPLGNVAQPSCAYPSDIPKRRTMIQLLLSPFLGHHYSQGCDSSSEAQEELSSDCCVLIAAWCCFSRWHCCTGHSWFHLVFDLAHGLAFIFLSQNVLFHFLWEEETSPFLYAEESDISLLNPVCFTDCQQDGF